MEKEEEKEEKEEEVLKEEKKENESELSFKSDHRNKQELSFGQKIVKKIFPNVNRSNVNTFPYKYFSCCIVPQLEEEELSDLDIYDGDTYMGNDMVNGVMSLFPKKYIRKDEENLFKFDKPNMISFFNSLKINNKFIRKFEKFEKFGLTMYMLDKHDFANDIPITRCIIEIPINLFTKGAPSPEEVGLAIIEPDKRLIFDKHYKEYKILKKLNQNTETMKIVTEKAMQMIIPREFFEKRTHFIDNDAFYSFSSSAPDSIRPPKKEPIRALDIFSFFMVENHNNNIIIDEFFCIDLKIGQPGPLIFMSLPRKMMKFTEELIKYLNH